MQLFDLKASRCPDAMLFVRRAINSAIENGYQGNVELRTIEPSMIRDLPYYCSQLDQVEILNVYHTKLSELTKQQWLDNDDAIEDELMSMKDQIIFHIKIDTQSNLPRK